MVVNMKFDYFIKFICVSCVLNASYNIYAQDLYYGSQQQHGNYNNQSYYWPQIHQGGYAQQHDGYQQQHGNYNNQSYYWPQIHQGGYAQQHDGYQQQHGNYNNQPYYYVQYGGDNYWNNKTFAADDHKMKKQKSKKDKKRKKNKKWKKKRIYKSKANK